MANRNDIAGVRSNTIRQVRDNLDLIDENYRKNPAHTNLFLDLLKAPYTLVSQLTRMRRYGVLGRYLPAFGKIVGQMQHDLFHIYTVDAHTMMVIRNMRKFRYRLTRQDNPIAYHCVHSIPKIELLYLSGIFHDIGKGRGGDHSVLGATDAENFCIRHGLNQADTELVVWLVKKHLYMSAVSQRQDIYDPDVVYKFAQEMKSEMRLDYLYALTVADIRATNPTLWNSWRATLLHQLYIETRKVLRRGLESPADKAATLVAYKERALERIDGELTVEQIDEIWQELGDDFFLRHTPVKIAELTEKIHPYKLSGETFIEIANSRGDTQGEGATQIYIYVSDKPNLFATTAILLSKLELSVVDASVNTSPSGMCFDTYTVLDENGNALRHDSPIREKIATELCDVIDNPRKLKLPGKRRLARQLQELSQPTEVHLHTDKAAQASTLTILANDRPGLLAAIGLLFVELDLHLLSAKITTLGERVEDIFVILDNNQLPIPDGDVAEQLKKHHMRAYRPTSSQHVVAPLQGNDASTFKYILNQ